MSEERKGEDLARCNSVSMTFPSTLQKYFLNARRVTCRCGSFCTLCRRDRQKVPEPLHRAVNGPR